jgi:hypothetical protein
MLGEHVPPGEECRDSPGAGALAARDPCGGHLCFRGDGDLAGITHAWVIVARVAAVARVAVLFGVGGVTAA